MIPRALATSVAGSPRTPALASLHEYGLRLVPTRDVSEAPRAVVVVGAEPGRDAVVSGRPLPETP